MHLILNLRIAIWLRGLKNWYLVLGGVAVGHGFEPQSDLELFSAKIIIILIPLQTLVIRWNPQRYPQMTSRQHATMSQPSLVRLPSSVRTGY
jgi:hypothetical protein